MKKKSRERQVRIPKPLVYEVDRVVTETGFYSDKFEFITDAVRRLLIESKKEVIDEVSNQRNQIKEQNQAGMQTKQEIKDQNIPNKNRAFDIPNDDP